MRGELRKQQVGFKDVNVEGGNSVVVTLRDEAQRAKAVEAIRAVDPTLSVVGQRRGHPARLFRRRTCSAARRK